MGKDRGINLSKSDLRKAKQIEEADQAEENAERKNQEQTAAMKNMAAFFEESKAWLFGYTAFISGFNSELITRVKPESFPTLLRNCPVILLTANSVEYNIVTQKLYLESNKGVVHPSPLKEIFTKNCTFQFAKVYGIDIVHVHPMSTGSFSREGSSDALKNVLNVYRPRLVVSIGVAFGSNPTAQRLGDVLISNKLFPYDAFQKDNDGQIQLRSDDVYRTDARLGAWSALLRSSHFSLEQDTADRRDLLNNELTFCWKLGTVLSGGSVLSNKQRKEALLRAAGGAGEHKVIGGEMEGFGVYYECRGEITEGGIPCVVIKGICDWGEEKNSWNSILEAEKKKNSSFQADNDTVKDCVQAYSADHAVEALFRLLRFDAHFITDDPPHELPAESLTRGEIIKTRITNAIRRKDAFRLVTVFLCVAFLLLAAVGLYVYGRDKLINGETLNIAVFPQSFRIAAAVLFLLTAGAAVFDVWNRRILRPISEGTRWACIRIASIRLGTITISVENPITMYDTLVKYWRASDNIVLESYRLGHIHAPQELPFPVCKRQEDKVNLQIEYKTENGDCYFHLFSLDQLQRAALVPEEAYKETIYQKRGNKSILADWKKAVILRETGK